MSLVEAVTLAQTEPSHEDRPLMTYWLDEPRRQQQIAGGRAFGVTLGLSLLVHALALFVVLRSPLVLSPREGPDAISEPMRVRLAAAAPPAPLAVHPSPPRIVTAPQPSRHSRPAQRKSRPPPVIAAPAPALPLPRSPDPAPPVSKPPQAQPQEADLWSYVQARRRERGEPTESLVPNRGAEEGANLAANLPQPATGAATKDMNRGGGIFEIKRMIYDDAAFVFFGWNPEMGRQTPQLITVRIGDNANMRIAVVRRMIAIIREHTQRDFVWRSVRHDRDLVLSARPEDNAGLEAFLLREFFDEREPQ